MTDPYQILGVSRNATDEQIKQAYKELARKYHPDNYANNPLSDLAEDKMKEYMLLGLRKIEGVKISEFKNKFIENPIYLRQSWYAAAAGKNWFGGKHRTRIGVALPTGMILMLYARMSESRMCRCQILFFAPSKCRCGFWIPR